MSLPAMIEDLLDPAALPDETRRVSLVQTHISAVLVGDRFAYKIKKPVNFGFLDFLTLEKRAFYCRREVILNRRLAKEIYIDVLPVYFDGRHYSMKNQEGQVVEYAVKMKRVPSERLMIALYRKGALTKNHLRRLAGTLAAFHKSALRTPEIDRFGEAEAFRVNTEENFAQIKKYAGITIGRKAFTTLERWTERFYRSHSLQFRRRVEEGKIRDCHGDLHMEHVCFSRNIAIIDCIEFNDRFRYSDTVADVAFLLMDLEYHGGADLARKLWQEYQDRTEDRENEDLLRFYKVYRAVVRGKVNSFQIDDRGITPEAKERAADRARRYFELALSYAA